MRKKAIAKEDLYPVGTRIIMTSKSWLGLEGVVTDVYQLSLELSIHWNKLSDTCYRQELLSSHRTEPPSRTTEHGADEYETILAIQDASETH
jgi:hypothetical protein